MTKKNILKMNANEIIWNLINCLLAGALVFVGAFTDGNISWTGIITAIMAGAIVFITKFKAYWIKEEHEYKSKIFNFVG